MKLAVELFRDDEVAHWGYRVPALAIVGTGCRDREEAQKLALEAVRFVIEAEGQQLDRDSEVLLFDVELRLAAKAS